MGTSSTRQRPRLSPALEDCFRSFPYAGSVDPEIRILNEVMGMVRCQNSSYGAGMEDASPEPKMFQPLFAVRKTLKSPEHFCPYHLQQLEIHCVQFQELFVSVIATGIPKLRKMELQISGSHRADVLGNITEV